MRLVLLPQAFRVVIPPLVGNYVASAKDTALASSISIIELLKAGLVREVAPGKPLPADLRHRAVPGDVRPLTRFSGLLEKKMKSGQRQVRL